MGLMGLGIGPALSGLQIALKRSVAPRQIGGAMGTLLLLRQVGGAVALASAETVYRSGLHDQRRSRPAPACSRSACRLGDRGRRADLAPARRGPPARARDGLRTPPRRAVIPRS